MPHRKSGPEPAATPGQLARFCDPCDLPEGNVKQEADTCEQVLGDRTILLHALVTGSSDEMMDFLYETGSLSGFARTQAMKMCIGKILSGVCPKADELNPRIVMLAALNSDEDSDRRAS